MPRPTLETFLDWLEGRGVQVICCGAKGQSTNNYYEEVVLDHRAKDPALQDLKRRIRLPTDKVQCREIRKALWLPQVGTLRGGLEAM
ncbi:MAG: hypothetical protein AB2556_26085 [Candidatus Thiodiazotropha sp.]